MNKIQAISDQVAYITIKLNKRWSLQVIQLHAPTSTLSDEQVEQLYEDISTSKRNENAKFELFGRLQCETLSNIGQYVPTEQ